MRYHKRYLSSKSKTGSLFLSLISNPNPFAVSSFVQYFQDQEQWGLQVPWCCRSRIDSASLAVLLEGEGGGDKCGACESGSSWCLSNPTQHHALVLLLQSWGLLLCPRHCAPETPWSTSAGTGKWLHGTSSVRLNICLLLTPKCCTYLHYPRSSAFPYLKGTWLSNDPKWRYINQKIFSISTQSSSFTQK